MRIVELAEIRSALEPREAMRRMRDALIAQSCGECDTPMPMHLAIAPERAEVHMKSSYRLGGKHFALKIAATFPGNAARGLSASSGMMLLSSAETGEPVAFFADEGYLTDYRTAAASAMVTCELGRNDTALGILGTGVQARLEAQLHAAVLDLKRIWIWGRDPERAAACARDVQALAPGAEVRTAASPAEVAHRCRLIVTATASRAPLLAAADLVPGTHVSAIGSDAPGKQELDPEVLRRAALLLVDSLRQCENLGELQHALSERGRAVEIGAFCRRRPAFDPGGITVCDFTGLGAEDLFIAEYCYNNLRNRT
jgi:ornithine cyclodeaminase